MSDGSNISGNESNGGQRPTCLWWDAHLGSCDVGTPRADVQKGMRDFCAEFVKTLRSRHRLHLAAAWSVDPVNRKLILLACDAETNGIPKKTMLDFSETVSAIAVDRREVTRIADIRGGMGDGRTCVYKEMVRSQGPRTMVSAPVINTCNINQVLMVVDLVPAPDEDGLSDTVLSQEVDSLALRFEAYLQNRCTRYASRLGIAIGRAKRGNPKNVFRSVIRLVAGAVGADSVALYLEDSRRERLDRQEYTGDYKIQDYVSGLDELVENCWRSNRERLITSQSPTVWGELMPAVMRRKVVCGLFLPLRDVAGQAVGTICCLRSGEEGGAKPALPFTYEDIAVIEAIGQAFAPHLEILRADYQRGESLKRLAHELRVPVVAFRAVMERVEHECKQAGVTFRFDHFTEMKTYCDTMSRMLLVLDVARKGIDSIPLQRKMVHVFSRIIAPAVRFVRPLLKKKGLDKDQIKYAADMHTCPRLWLDEGLMTQVVFNLLDNAIKYGGKSKDFHLEIAGEDVTGGYEIAFRDCGMGIPDGWEEEIFEAGVRGLNAFEHDVAGEGFGLWFAREIVERHGGTLTLRRRGNPTEFVISFPDDLRSSPLEDS